VQRLVAAIPVEYASQRKIRERELLAEYFVEHKVFPRCNAAET